MIIHHITVVRSPLDLQVLRTNNESKINTMKVIPMIKFYGNEYETLSGIIRDVQQRTIKVEFNTVHAKNQIVSVPKNIISSSYELTPGLYQDLKLPTWFLKRNHIIPLNDDWISPILFIFRYLHACINLIGV